MDKIKLLIVDQDTRFAELSQRFLQSFTDINVIGMDTNGQDGLKSVRNMHPDAVLFDLVLPGMDGITFLQSVNALPNPPAMICCTRFYSDVALEGLRIFGAAYVMFKPMELQALHPAIVSCTQMHRKMRKLHNDIASPDHANKQDAVRIHNYIVSLGVPAKLIGCSYLTEAVRLATTDLNLTRNLSKGLYLEISRNMNTSPARIERCMRNAISAAYHNGGLIGKMVSCPSNKEFINYLLRTIDL